MNTPLRNIKSILDNQDTTAVISIYMPRWNYYTYMSAFYRILDVIKDTRWNIAKGEEYDIPFYKFYLYKGE